MSAGHKLKSKLNAVRHGQPDTVEIHVEPTRSVVPHDLGRPIFINELSGPIEYLTSRGELESGKDIAGMGGVRFHTAIRFRELVEGAQVKNLRSPNLGGTGGGSGKAGDIPGYKLDCMIKVDGIKSAMPKPWVFEMLLQVVWNDDWLDLKTAEIKAPEGADAITRERIRKTKELKRKHRLGTIETLCWALDIAALQMGYTDRQNYRRRWLRRKPRPSAQAAHRIQETMA